MKIIIVNSTIDNYSTGLITASLYSWLKKRGDSVQFYYGSGNNSLLSSDKQVKRIGTKANRYLHGVLSLITGMHGYFSLFATIRLIRKLKKDIPDVFILGNLHGYYLDIPLFMKWLKRTRVPVFQFMFDEYPFLGKCAFAGDCVNYQLFCHDCPKKKEYPRSLFFDTSHIIFNDKKKTYKDFDSLSFVGYESTIKTAEKSKCMELFNGKYYPMGWGIDPSYCNVTVSDEFYSQIGVDKEKIIILSVAPLSNERKGIKKYYYSLAKEMNCRDEYVFIHVGKDCNDIIVPQNVVCFPFIKDKSFLAKLYTIADLFIITSESEGLPTSCVESLFCGTPILGFDISGMPFVAPSPIGKYVEPFRVDELKRVVMNTQKKRKEESARCKQFAKMKYSYESVNPRLYETIEMSIKEKQICGKKALAN